jgi:hypothetical protein
MLRALTLSVVAVIGHAQQPDQAQKALDQICATIDQAISLAKQHGDSAVIVQMEDPQYEGGFSDGFKALVILLCRRFTSEGYQIGITTTGPKVQIRISWTDV